MFVSRSGSSHRQEISGNATTTRWTNGHIMHGSSRRAPRPASEKETMNTTPSSEAQYLLKRLMVSCPDDATFAHRWPSEVDRWKELAFALLSSSSTVAECRVREATDQLAALDLLSVSELAAMIKTGYQLDDRSLNNQTFWPNYVLIGHGLPEEAQCVAVHRTGTAQAGVHRQVSNRRETAYGTGGDPIGFAVGPE